MVPWCGPPRRVDQHPEWNDAGDVPVPVEEVGSMAEHGGVGSPLERADARID